MELADRRRRVHLHTRLVTTLCAATWLLLLVSCGTTATSAPMLVRTAPPGALRAPTSQPPSTVAPARAITNQVLAATPTVRALPSPTPEHVPTAAPLAPTPTPPRELTAAERKRLFEQVWQLVNDRYLYANFNGIDWQTTRAAFAARVAASQTNQEFYTIMTDMVAQLNDQHSRFGPPAMVVSEDAVVSGHEATVGIGVLTTPTEDGAFVQIVFPDSPAARADLRPRDRIITVDGRPYHISDDNLQGPEHTTVRLTVVRPGEKPRDVVLPRQEVQTRIAPYYQRFPNDVGYIWISTLWVHNTDEQVSGTLTELVSAGALKGLILDLRGNPGGWSHVLSGILSHFVRGQVGVFYDRDGQIRPLVVPPSAGPDMRGEPLVVLIDHDTASYAEVLAAVLQREANAQVIGAASSGNTETIYAHTLFDGSRLWLAQEGFRLQSGDDLEGRGVQPDVVVDVDWKRYSEEDDPQLQEALRLIELATQERAGMAH